MFGLSTSEIGLLITAGVLVGKIIVDYVRSKNKSDNNAKNLENYIESNDERLDKLETKLTDTRTTLFAGKEEILDCMHKSNEKQSEEHAEVKERVSVLEVQVSNVEGKVDDVKSDTKEIKSLLLKSSGK